MYIKVVELEEPYLFDKCHFQIHAVNFEKNWTWQIYYRKCIEMFGKCMKHFFNWVCQDHDFHRKLTQSAFLVLNELYNFARDITHCWYEPKVWNSDFYISSNCKCMGEYLFKSVSPSSIWNRKFLKETKW